MLTSSRKLYWRVNDVQIKKKKNNVLQEIVSRENLGWRTAIVQSISLTAWQGTFPRLRSFLFILGKVGSRDTMHKIDGELKINGYVTARGYFWNKRRHMRGQFITLVNNSGIEGSIFHGSCTCRLKRKLKKMPAVRQHLRSGLKWMTKCLEIENGKKNFCFNSFNVSPFHHKVLPYIIIYSMLTAVRMFFVIS